MLKVAVWTGVKRGRLIPHCLYTGSTASPAYAWMVRMGVRVILHDPTWADDLVALATSGDAAARNAQHSHLYASREGVIGTWQRIDIPLLRGLPYEHLLFTDSDVVFTRRVALAEFGSPLPECLAMGTEIEDTTPYNAGVMLMRTACLRDTHAAFMAFIRRNENGLFFPGFGPQDQGALNQFYQPRIVRMPKKWNAKPYHAAEPGAVIVHFHGPKPEHYRAFAATGVCPLNFGGLCAQGYRASAPASLALYDAALAEVARAGAAWERRVRPAGGLPRR
jgi:hypothetical protein